ncbi:MAG: hypothetical protein DRP47_11235, partial [Candidatus Zixiibacteriota bacterium]
DKWCTHSISVSPNNRYIAFIEETKSECTRDGLYKVAPQRSLVIMDSSGKVDRRIDDMDVKKYVWSPDGTKLAYLTFEPCDCDYTYKCPSGAWVYDLASSKTEKIADLATEIHWAAFDDAIYLYYPNSVQKWSPSSGSLEKTHHKDIYFSPDGQYYLQLWKDEGKPIVLYETITDKVVLFIEVRQWALPKGDMAETFSTDMGVLWSSHDLTPPHGWAFNTGHYLLFTKTDVENEKEGRGPMKIVESQDVQRITYTVYNPERRMSLRTFEGVPGNWISNGFVIPIERDGSVVLEEAP